MAETQIERLLTVANQVMGICIQTNARSAALESLLIDKGLVTEAELNARNQQLAENEKRLSEALGSALREGSES